MHTTPALVTTLMRQLEQQEGRINHMYRDTRGFITVGVGHLLSHPQAATRQAFIHRDSQQPASDAEIRAEFRHLLTLNVNGHLF